MEGIKRWTGGDTRAAVVKVGLGIVTSSVP